MEVLGDVRFLPDTPALTPPEGMRRSGVKLCQTGEPDPKNNYYAKLVNQTQFLLFFDGAFGAYGA